MTLGVSALPAQKIPQTKKNAKWREACVDAIVGREDNTIVMGKSRLQRMQSNYDLYNGIYDIRELKHITNPFNVADTFPATPQEMNIIRSKINLMIGEESKRPQSLWITQSNDDVMSSTVTMTKELLDQYINWYVMSQLDPDGAKQQQGEVMTPIQIQKYITKDYKDVGETLAQHTINKLELQLNLQNEFLKGWQDGLIAGEEIYYVGENNLETTVERVNPKFFSYDMSPDTEFIENGEWCLRRILLTPFQIHDRFYDKIDEKTLEKIIELGDGTRPGNIGTTPYTPGGGIQWTNRFTEAIDTQTSRAINMITVYHACWKSWKKVGFLTYLDELGQEQEMTVEEGYIPAAGEKIEWDWVSEVWEGYKAGQDVYFGIQPLTYQHISIDNPNSSKLPYTGVVYSNVNSRSRSLVDIMRPLQYFYIVLWYRLEMALARDKGRVLTMDITQIPKSFGLDPAKWLNYLSTAGVVFINPYEEGFDIPGREGGRAASFNQISSVDLSMANNIQSYIDLMNKIEYMIGELTGISPQRQGSIHHSELVGNVERTVVQSSHITEPLFWKHNQAKKHVYQMALDTTKYLWKISGKESLNYVTDDATRVFLALSPDFLYEDFDIYITDSTKEAQNIEALKTLIQPAMQNGASLIDAAEIMTARNMSSLKNKLRELDEIAAQRAQAAQEQQMQMQMAIQESVNEIDARKLEMEKYKADLQADTQIRVKAMDLEQKESDSNRSGIPDVIDLRKLELTQRKQDMDLKLKTAKMEIDAIKSSSDNRLRQLEIEAAENKIQNDRAIAEAKRREAEIDAESARVKAKTDEKKAKTEIAIKNKDLEIKDVELKTRRVETNLKKAELQAAEYERELELIKLSLEEELGNRKLDIDEMEVVNNSITDRMELRLEDKALDLEKERLNSNQDS